MSKTNISVYFRVSNGTTNDLRPIKGLKMAKIIQRDARFAIDDLQVTAANYTTAWNNLETRYDHRRLLVQDHLKALKTFRPLKEELSASLQHLLDELKRHRNQLRTLGRPV